ncbi:dTDP-4-dehydrorhamnose reductase [Oxalobacter vibrioformis]|uniref:dTDP-4-dehydrorhamnose reductase n=1 Tax=Oxalobacter vibrioformis TaxID=933080 RepID=A0A9E9LUQ7_9BURK|nr:dTDP-4-dehydrorhamnose reductase [Oxalobacter vibrioformis]WAW09077.1 dTDP-4-dehydrorhamnose reductase [Oxalobacter vibrioformis]
MKILLLGKNGQVGHELLRTLYPLGEVIALDRNQVDLADKDRLREIVRGHGADVIVNAAAYTAVDRAEEEERLAFQINADAVELLADHARHNGTLLVHYSTDYVFDGKKDTPYVETDITNPPNVYGKSKLAGELAVQQAGCHHFIFRTSWVHAFHGQNFIKTIWRLGKERETLNVVADQTGAPTSAELIADVTALSIAAFYRDILPEGIHHLVASGETSWYGLACYLMDQASRKNRPMKLTSAGITPITSEEYPLPARRPHNSRLDNSALSRSLGFQLPDWHVHVDRIIEQLVQVEPA